MEEDHFSECVINYLKLEGMTSVATSSTKSLPPLGRGYKRQQSSRPGTSQPYNLEGYEEIFEMMSEEKNPFALPPD